MDKNLLRGALSTIILKLLDEYGELYGYQIIQKIKALSKGEMTVTEGALYPALHKLEAKGVLTVEYREYQNRPRKYYSLTPKGQQEKVLKLREFEDFVKNMQFLLNPNTLQENG